MSFKRILFEIFTNYGANISHRRQVLTLWEFLLHNLVIAVFSKCVAVPSNSSQLSALARPNVSSRMPRVLSW